jgi:DNA polymerase III delta subunit
LFELALEGKSEQLTKVLSTLEMTEDPYKLFGLLSSQVVQLAAVTFAKDDDTPTKDFGIHPYVAGKLERQAKRMGSARVAHIITLFADTDANLKRSRGEPWLLIETTLQSVASRS